MFFLILLGIAMLVGVIFMAISKKSSFKVRVTALGALALMIITVIICLFLFFSGTKAPKQFILPPDVNPADLPPPEASNPFTMVMFIVFLIALFVMVVVLSLRESKRSGEKEPEFGKDTGSW